MAKHSRLVLGIGYHHILLPESLSSEHVRDIVNSILVDHEYINGKTVYFPSTNERVVLEIIPDSSYSTIIIDRSISKEKEVIAKAIISKLVSKDKLFYASDEIIKVGTSRLEWPAIENPKFDPDEFINMIVDAYNLDKKLDSE